MIVALSDLAGNLSDFGRKGGEMVFSESCEQLRQDS
jgi:hypothetical protein